MANVTGAVALADDPRGSGYVVAAANEEGCPGIAVVTVKSRSEQLGRSDQRGQPGEVALSTAGETGWLVIGDKTYRSASAGDDLARTDR